MRNCVAQFKALGFDPSVNADQAGILHLLVPVFGGALGDLPDAIAPPSSAAPVVSCSARLPVPRDKAGRVVWTAKMDGELISRREKGDTSAEIAVALGVSLGSVTARLDRMNRSGAVVPPPMVQGRKRVLPARMARHDGSVALAWSEEHCLDLIRFYEVEGLELDEIAARMGRTSKGISLKLMRLRREGRVTVSRGPAVRGMNKWPDDQVAFLRASFAHIPAAEIAARLGRSRGAVSGMACRLGLSRQTSPAQLVAPKAAAKTEPARKQKSEPKVAPAFSEPVPVAARIPAANPVVEPQAQPASFDVPKGAGVISARQLVTRFDRPAARFMAGMTDRQKAETVAAHIDGLAPDAVLSATDDVALCEAIWAGRSVGEAAAALGLAPGDALARFNAIVAPMRNPDARGLPIEAASWVLPPLRTRAACGDAV